MQELLDIDSSTEYSVMGSAANNNPLIVVLPGWAEHVIKLEILIANE